MNHARFRTPLPFPDDTWADIAAAVAHKLAGAGTDDPRVVHAVRDGAAKVLRAMEKGARGVLDSEASGTERTALSRAWNAYGDQAGREDGETAIPRLAAMLGPDGRIEPGYKSALFSLWKTEACLSVGEADSQKPHAETDKLTTTTHQAALSALEPRPGTDDGPIPYDRKDAIVRAIRGSRADGGMFLIGFAMQAILTEKGGIDRMAHGLTKGNELAFLHRLLTEGVDRSRPFSEAPLWIPEDLKAAAAAFGTAGGVAYHDGPFILVAPPGKSLLEGGVDAVLVNDEIAAIALPELEKAYPETKFLRFSQVMELWEAPGG